MGRISPLLLLVIVILAILFFLFSLLLFLIRCLLKNPSFSSVSQSNRYPDASTSQTFQRQLQQLFQLHDSGLDQSVIDALPVFYYKEIIGLKEPFDCAVCLYEFLDSDHLKLLPNCSHAFHIQCIETWLMSNSTCPLCRTFVDATGNSNPSFHFDSPIEQWSLPYPIKEDETFLSCGPRNLNEKGGSARVFSVRLGKFKSLNGVVASEDKSLTDGGDSSSRSIDARRCFSLGAFQYVVNDTELQVALCSENGESIGEIDGRKINTRNRGESFSVSKIWLWSKKTKFSSSLDSNENVVLPLPNRTSAV